MDFAAVVRTPERPPIQGYAPKSIDHTIDVLSAVLRTAMKWGHILGVCNANRQFHLAEQRLEAIDLPGVHGVESAEINVAEPNLRNSE